MLNTWLSAFVVIVSAIFAFTGVAREISRLEDFTGKLEFILNSQASPTTPW